MGAQEPPQSVSVSVPFRTMSVHAGTAQVRGAAVGQTPLRQPVAARHILPLAQPGQPIPPQSTSPSSPFLMPSVQLGAWHRPPIQFALWQSPPTVHIRAGRQRGQPEVAPPQSISPSPPFLTWSRQVLAAQVPPAQTRLAQSPPPLHLFAVPHPPQGPPQSTSLSLLFFTVSVQDGAAHVPALQTPLMQ
ncbi:MAG: hypothetical protein ABUL77_00295 [Bacteroidota bacterium]